MDEQHRGRSFGRWYILGLICLMYLITYLDRVNISVAAPLLMKHFHINKLEWGLVLSVFSWTYSTFQIPIGMLSDKYGPRKVMAVLVSFGMAIAGTLLCLSVAGLVTSGLRVGEDDEFGGLDLSQHGENAYVFGASSYGGGGHGAS